MDKYKSRDIMKNSHNFLHKRCYIDINSIKESVPFEYSYRLFQKTRDIKIGKVVGISRVEEVNGTCILDIKLQGEDNKKNLLMSSEHVYTFPFVIVEKFFVIK